MCIGSPSQVRRRLLVGRRQLSSRVLRVQRCQGQTCRCDENGSTQECCKGSESVGEGRASEADEEGGRTTVFSMPQGSPDRMGVGLCSRPMRICRCFSTEVSPTHIGFPGL